MEALSFLKKMAPPYIITPWLTWFYQHTLPLCMFAAGFHSDPQEADRIRVNTNAMNTLNSYTSLLLFLCLQLCLCTDLG